MTGAPPTPIPKEPDDLKKKNSTTQAFSPDALKKTGETVEETTPGVSEVDYSKTTKESGKQKDTRRFSVEESIIEWVDGRKRRYTTCKETYGVEEYVGPRYELRLNAEPILLEQWKLDNLHAVFGHLNENSVKAGEAYRIYLSTQVDGGKLVIDFSDNGQGIEKGLGEEMFEEGVQGKERHGDWGGGLAICRKLMSEVGGSIEYVKPTPKETPPKGRIQQFLSSIPRSREKTTFRLTIPLDEK